MEADTILIQQIEALVDGETVHLRANLVGTYRTAIAEFNRTGDASFLQVASDVKNKLQALLTKHRIQQACTNLPMSLGDFR